MGHNLIWGQRWAEGQGGVRRWWSRARGGGHGGRRLRVYPTHSPGPANPPGLVFFWAGAASVNYFLRSISVLNNTAWVGRDGAGRPPGRRPGRLSRCRCCCPPHSLQPCPTPLAAQSYIAIPLIYIFMVLIRIGCVGLFNLTFFRWLRECERGGAGAGSGTLQRSSLACSLCHRSFRAVGAIGQARFDSEYLQAPLQPMCAASAVVAFRAPTHSTAPLRHPVRAALTWQEVIFTGWAGLRGAVSLILIADFVNATSLKVGAAACSCTSCRAGRRVCCPVCSSRSVVPRTANTHN